MLGIKDIFIEDVREEFVRDFVFPMFRANAVYEGQFTCSARRSPVR
jgi:argininosuccinate synthase